MTQATNKDARDRFVGLLRATGRDNIDYIIEDLEAWGFFTAPASAQGHYAYPGGLLDHSLNVYDAAVNTRDWLLKDRPDLEVRLSLESIAITALLHDVCKADFYRLVRKKKRNEIGAYEEVETYEIHDENFPVGHGEKSAILLLQSGLDLSDEEICAIRWHMGPWNLSRDDERYYRQASRFTPLQALIHTADTIASSLIERPAEKL